MTTRFDTEEGFSLTEMLVVLVILGIVLSATYLMVGTSDGITKTSDRRSTSASELAAPLDTISRFAMQQAGIEAPTPYSVEVWTDRDMDSNREKNLFTATAAGELTWERWEYDRYNSATVLSHEAGTMSSANSNVAQGEPLFRYYDKDGTELTDMSAVSSDAFSILCTIVVDLGDGRTATDSRHITFRNKS